MWLEGPLYRGKLGGTMKLISKISALGAVVLLSTAFASADNIQLGSYATGADPMGNANSAINFAGFQYIPQPLGNQLPNPQPQNGNAPTYFLDPGNVWATALPNSTWVGEAWNAGPVNTSNPDFGYYTFNTTFTATGVYSGFINVMADDTTSVLLNGVTIVTLAPLGSDITCADTAPTCTTQDLVWLSGLNLSGTNTLTFIVQQQGVGPAGGVNDPSGFDFSATLSQTPEPNTLLLLGTGLVGSAGALFRRMRA
jgi:PEP-CTERM motif